MNEGQGVALVSKARTRDLPELRVERLCTVISDKSPGDVAVTEEIEESSALLRWTCSREKVKVGAEMTVEEEEVEKVEEEEEESEDCEEGALLLRLRERKDMM